MRSPDRGSTTGDSQLDDRERSERAARRASEASQSPPTAIFKEELVRRYELFFRILPHRGDEKPRPGYLVNATVHPCRRG